MRQILERVGPDLDALSQEVRSTGRVRQITSALFENLASQSACKAYQKKLKELLLREKESWVQRTCSPTGGSSDQPVSPTIYPLDETDTKILSLIALANCETITLDIGCSCFARCSNSESPVKKRRRDGVDFIALQRRRDGRYGFLDRLAEKPEQTADSGYGPLFLPDDTQTRRLVVQDEAASMAMSSALAAVGETA